MNKIKVEQKSKGTRIIISSQKGQQLKQNEIDQIMQNKINCLLKMSIISKSSGFKLIYDVTGYVPLSDYLSASVNRLKFADVLKKTLRNIMVIGNACFDLNGVLLSPEYIMVNPHTLSISFIYVPIQFYGGGFELKSFLLKLVDICNFDRNEDNSYIQEYIRILNSGTRFSIFDLQQYAERISNTRRSVKQDLRCPHCGISISPDSKYCGSCGKKILERPAGAGPDDTYVPPTDHFSKAKSAPVQQNMVNDPAAAVQPVPQPVPQIEPQPAAAEQPAAQQRIVSPHPVKASVAPKAAAVHVMEKPQPIQPEQTVEEDIDDDDQGTTVLSRNDGIDDLSAYLVRESTGEEICIEKTEFTVGHSRTNDYCISGNTAVSRRHLKIVKEGGRFYLHDLGSTNGTFINGRRLPPNTASEIINGSSILIANEAYKFEIR